ncbi:MAG: succinyldiaminopimelate transaminase [Helicobacter sp.]|nr:succinyldiaminopimelate transaminase [Helicobacter sp.]
MLVGFQSYPFEKLNQLFLSIPKPQNTLNLTIGEPQFQTPQIILDKFTQNAHLLNKYPKSSGEEFLQSSQRNFVQKRFGVELNKSQLISTFGTREVLFNFPQFFLFGKSHPVIAYPNPFYQIYEGAAIASNAKSLLMELNAHNGFKPHLEKQELEQVDLVILNSPNNPTGVALNINELSEWVKLALEYNFVILSDECYSEIYAKDAPDSILQASLKAGNPTFKNILSLNSISKRSSAPGLRSGFIAGDEQILKNYAKYRTYIGCAIPLPLQEAANIAWSDFENPAATRAIYAKNLQSAQEIFPQAYVAPYSFYLWLRVGDDLGFSKELFAQKSIMVLPGSFLGRNGAGEGYVRIALVYEDSIIRQALQAIKSFI